MADVVDLKGVVKHLVDGTFEQNVCRICLLPLGEICENIFTKICKAQQEYCIADVLGEVFEMQFSDADNYSVCADCFILASTAYKFYKMCKRSSEILNFYTDELEKNVDFIEMNKTSDDTLCITLPEYTPVVKSFECNINGCLQNDYIFVQDSYHHTSSRKLQPNKSKTIKHESSTNKPIKPILQKYHTKYHDKVKDDMVIVIDEKGQKTFYMLTDDGKLVQDLKKTKAVKIRKKRERMEFTKCSQCPVKYRFMSKLKTHMKAQHDLDLFICKVCKAIYEDEQEYETHLSSHTGIHRCYHCNTVFKKRKTIIAHLKWHEEMKNMANTESAHVCELCGFILPDEEQLREHYDKKHEKKYTCHYCGKIYKGEMSCEAHIKKHEKLTKTVDKVVKAPRVSKEPCKEDQKRSMCSTCGKHFVDDRSLMWHSMLHTNERPYTCDVCGRGFISVNRRNQHVLCAHTMPTKQCPLCPALFHLRSMVNSHIKKVHLKAHKRRNRSSKHQNMNVHWRTERVPIQLLSVDIQNDILELNTQNDHDSTLRYYE